MNRLISWLAVLVLTITLAFAPIAMAGGAKKYQVTGKVVDLSDTVVTVEKSNGEKWELNRDPKAVVKGELKVGAKVTIQYTMTATNVEVKTK